MHKNNTVAKSSLSDIVNLRKSSTDEARGFTIIEVMIVLAIAALILLIVLLAVPALQRSSRNTQRKNDVSAVSTAIANFISNNGGAIPTADGYASGDDTTEYLFCKGATVTINGASVTQSQSSGYSSDCTTSNSNSESAKFGYYKSTDSHIFFANASSGFSAATSNTTPTATTVTTESMTIDMGYGCNSTNTGPSTMPSSRTASVLYATETSGGADLQCVEQ